jgi:hypothetical protein
MPLLEIGELYQLGSGGLVERRGACGDPLAPMAACFREMAMHDNTLVYGGFKYTRGFILWWAAEL